MKIHFAEKLKYIREKNNLTQEQLALKSHCHINSIRNYEKGKRLPSLDIASDIADVLNVSVDELVGKDENIK